MLFISEIELPRTEDAAAFAEFMRDEYIPAVHKGPTRIGQVAELELLQGNTTETSHRFLWLVRWNGLEHEKAGARVDDEAVARKFEGFGAGMTEHVSWAEVAREINRETI
jgi:hypothetical protein